MQLVDKMIYMPFSMEYERHQVKHMKKHLSFSFAMQIYAYIFERHTNYSYYNSKTIVVNFMKFVARFNVLFNTEYTLQLCASNTIAKLKSFAFSLNSFYPS